MKNKEYKVQEKLSKWLEDFGMDVYWGENVHEDYGSFSLDSGLDRPDMLVIGSENVFVVEVKNGKDSSNVYDGVFECHNYWRYFEEGVKAVTEGDVFSVDAILLATQFSKEGRLFKEEREGGKRETYKKDEVYWNSDRPRFEFLRTEAVPRLMWRYAWDFKESDGGSRKNISTGLGVLLSSSLDEGSGQVSLDNLSGSEKPKILAYDGEKSNYWERL